MLDNKEDLKVNNGMEEPLNEDNTVKIGADQEGGEEYSLNDDRRVKVLSPMRQAMKRFMRNRLAIFGTVTLAYPLSKKYLRGRNFWLNMVIFSMFFSGGMIPGYIVVSSRLQLRGTYWALLLPGAISAYNMMIVKNFFQGIPQELEESAHLDGCNDLSTLVRIVLPLSLPVLATFGLFYAVGHWNSYFPAMIYLTDDKMYPLQLILRNIIVTAEAAATFSESTPCSMGMMMR